MLKFNSYFDNMSQVKCIYKLKVIKQQNDRVQIPIGK